MCVCLEFTVKLCFLRGEGKWQHWARNPQSPEVGDVQVESNCWTSLGSQAGVWRAVAILSVRHFAPSHSACSLEGVQDIEDRV